MTLEAKVEDLFNEEEMVDFSAWCCLYDFHIPSARDKLLEYAKQDLHFLRHYGNVYLYMNILEEELLTVPEYMEINGEY